jgi:predicted TIM-barrel fold metal-dependent hydrolase
MEAMHPESPYEVRSLGLAPLDAAGRAAIAALPPLISVDSHVMEPDHVWRSLPPRLHEKLYATLAIMGFQPPPVKGASDPHERLLDQKRDGIQAEIIFPNNGMALFGIDDVETQEVAFRVYNDFLADFCRVAPERFYGVPCVSVYDIDGAIAEMHRGLGMGLTGVLVWQVPDPRLPFTSDHYERLWAAAAEAGAPVHLHILTGHNYFRNQEKRVGMEKVRGSVNQKTHDTITTLFDLIFSGAFERHPKLRVVLAESECGWLPFILQQWDYYFERFRAKEPFHIKRRPSEIFSEHVYCTWLEDYSGTRQFTWWGQDNLMWSNDYPHPNMTFPHSRENVVHHIGNLEPQIQLKLLRDNAIKLYGFKNLALN